MIMVYYGIYPIIGTLVYTPMYIPYNMFLNIPMMLLTSTSSIYPMIIPSGNGRMLSTWHTIGMQNSECSLGVASWPCDVFRYVEGQRTCGAAQLTSHIFGWLGNGGLATIRMIYIYICIYIYMYIWYFLIILSKWCVSTIIIIIMN